MYDGILRAIKKLKNSWLVFCVLAILMAVGIYVLIPRVLNKTELLYQTYQMNSDTENEMLSLKKGMKLQQHFTVPYDNINKISIHYGNCGMVSDGILVLKLWDETTGQTIAESQQATELLKEDEYVSFVFPQVLSLNKEHKYKFVLDVKFEKEKSEAVVFIVKANDFLENELYMDESLLDGGLDFTITGYNNGYGNKSIFMFILCVLLLLIGLMCCYGLKNAGFDSVSWLEWIFVTVAVLACMLLFNQGFDMSLTLAHAKDLLSAIKHGEFFDFYSIVLDKAMHGGYLGNGVKDAAYYNIILYLIMAIWMTPCFMISKIFNVDCSERFYVLYFNVFVAVMLVYSVYLLYKLAIELGLERKKAVLTSYIYISSVTVLFSTVGFCQMDILYIVLILISLRLYLQNKYVRFSLLMSIAIMVKVFPILFFIPLILLVEKRLLHIVKYSLLGLSSTVIFKLLFGADAAYLYTQREMGQLYGFFGRAFTNQLAVGIGGCACFVFIIVVLCVWCFDKDCDSAELWKYVIVLPMIANYSFILFIWWHPEWLVMLMPFTSLAVILLPRVRSLIYCEWGMGVLFWLVAAYYFPNNVDNTMVNWGVLPELTGYEYRGINLNAVLCNIQYADVFLTSLLVALMVYFCYNSVRGIVQMKGSDRNEQYYLTRGLVYARIASVYLLCLLFVALYFYLG